MQTESTQESTQNTARLEKTKKREFGLPAGIVEHFEAKGIQREELAQMDIDTVLAQTGELEGKALNKAIQTILKTARAPEQIRRRLELLTGRETEESTLVSIVNSILYAHEHTLCTGEEKELLAFAYTLATEAEHANVRAAGRLVLAHLPEDESVIREAVKEKLDRFFPDTENLCPGEEDKMELHIALFGGTRKSKERLHEYISLRAEAITVLAKRCTGPLDVWKGVLAIYRKAEKEALPQDKVRALGLAVLKTLKEEEALVQACSQYVQSMRITMHDFGYGQFFLGALQLLPENEKTVHVTEKLVIYALTEKRGTAHSLENMGISRLPKERIFSILEKVRTEKINIISGVPVLKQIVRALKHSVEDLAVVEKYLENLEQTRRHSGLRGLLKHVQECTHPEQAKAHKEQASTETKQEEDRGKEGSAPDHIEE